MRFLPRVSPYSPPPIPVKLARSRREVFTGMVLVSSFIIIRSIIVKLANRAVQLIPGGAVRGIGYGSVHRKLAKPGHVLPASSYSLYNR